MDNYTTGSMDNLSGILHHPKLTLMYHDVTVEKELAFRADQIYHLACPASPKDYQSDPIKTLRTSFLGTRNMLEYAKKVGARILFTSTSEVYGDPLVSPQREEYWGNVNPIGIRSCYDEGKRVAETMMMDYHRHAGVDTRIARIFNTYGPRLRSTDGRVVSNFIVQALENQPLTVYGDGEQTRSFCFIRDQVRGLVRLMNTSPYHLPINIGNPEEISIRQMAEKIIQLTGSSSVLETLDLPQDDPRQRKPDISRAKKILDWTPEVNLEEGLRETIAYFRNIRT
jgi:UDP-glucuronate decarboxylase